MIANIQIARQSDCKNGTVAYGQNLSAPYSLHDLVIVL